MYRNIYQHVYGGSSQIKEILKILQYEEFTEYDEQYELMTYKFELYQWASIEELFIYQQQHKNIINFSARVLSLIQEIKDFIKEMNQQGICFNRITQQTIFINLKTLKFRLTSVDFQKRNQQNEIQDSEDIDSYFNQKLQGVSQLRLTANKEIINKNSELRNNIESWFNNECDKQKEYGLYLKNDKFMNQIIALMKNVWFIKNKFEYDHEMLINIAINIGFTQNKIKECVQKVIQGIKTYFQNFQLNELDLEQQFTKHLLAKLAELNMLNQIEIVTPLFENEQNLTNIIEEGFLFSFIKQLIDNPSLKPQDCYILMKSQKNSIKLFGLVIYSSICRNQILNKDQIKFIYQSIMTQFHDTYTTCKYILQNQLNKIFADLRPFNESFNRNYKILLNECYGEISAQPNINLEVFLVQYGAQEYIQNLFEKKYYEKMKEQVKADMLQLFKTALGE